MMKLTKQWVLLVLMLITHPALAHRLQVFASADGMMIRGQVYFAGGAKASHIPVMIQNAAGHTLAKLTAEDNGSFHYLMQSSEDHVVIADSGDGHRAMWRVTGIVTELKPESKLVLNSETKPELMAIERSADAELLMAIEQKVERAVARQVQPLREDLQVAESRANFRDILGGIGYLFGLTGILLWWRQSPRSSRKLS